MRRLLAIALLALIAPALAHADTVQLIRRAGGGAPAYEVKASTSDGTTVTSATVTLTTTALTTKVLGLVGFRNNAGQSIRECRFNTVLMTDSGATANVGSGHQTAMYYLSNPGAVSSGNLTCTMTSSVPGLGISGMAFTGATTVASTGTTAGTVATSSATATANANDILVSLMVKQDASTSAPVLNTAGALLKIDYTFSSTGNGGYWKAAILTCASGSNTINYSWTTTARTPHSWLVLQP